MHYLNVANLNYLFCQTGLSTTERWSRPCPIWASKSGTRAQASCCPHSEATKTKSSSSNLTRSPSTSSSRPLTMASSASGTFPASAASTSTKTLSKIKATPQSLTQSGRRTARPFAPATLTGSFTLSATARPNASRSFPPSCSFTPTTDLCCGTPTTTSSTSRPSCRLTWCRRRFWSTLTVLRIRLTSRSLPPEDRDWLTRKLSYRSAPMSALPSWPCFSNNSKTISNNNNNSNSCNNNNHHL